MFESRTFEIVVYPDSYDCSQIETMCKHEYIKDYAFALHDKDDNKPHYHIMIQTHETQNSLRIARDFNVNENAVEKAKTKKRTHKYDDMCLYLIHKNAPCKYQYEPSIVVSSFDYLVFIEKYKAREVTATRRAEIINLIHTGVIKEYNLNEYVSVDEYIKFSNAIKSAFSYCEIEQNNLKRNMQVVFITGKSGTGKTTFAKERAYDMNYDIFISSSSNDPFYGYAGQPCVIMDDLRGSALSYADWLKLLDNDTNSTVKARYSNKNLSSVKLLIITSSQTIEEFYRDIFDNNGESIIQLKRRIGLYIRMEKDFYYVSAWDNKIKGYTDEVRFKNNILLQFPDTNNSLENSLQCLGLDIKDSIPICNDFVDMTEEQMKQAKLLFG